MARPGPQRAAGRRGTAADRAAFPFPLHSLSTPPAPPLRPQTNLEVLWLNNNKIERVVNLDQNFRIKQLAVQDNVIRSLKGSLRYFKFLAFLDLENNNLRDLQEVLAHLEHFQFLKTLNLKGNPCCDDTKDYRLHVIHRVPSIHILDHRVVTNKERQEAKRLFKVKGSHLQIAFGKKAPPKKGYWSVRVPEVSPLVQDLQKTVAKRMAEEAIASGKLTNTKAAAKKDGKKKPQDYVIMREWVRDTSEVVEVPDCTVTAAPIRCLPETVERLRQLQLEKAPLRMVKTKAAI